MEITEDYVSIKTAKLLKEKGFDSEYLTNWCDERGKMFFEHHHCIRSNWRLKEGETIYPCPTIQMAMKWLREKHNVCIIPSLYDGEGRFYCFIYTNNYRVVKVLNKKCNTYESACENAIKHCLKYIITHT